MCVRDVHCHPAGRRAADLWGRGRPILAGPSAQVGQRHAAADAGSGPARRPARARGPGPPVPAGQGGAPAAAQRAPGGGGEVGTPRADGERLRPCKNFFLPEGFFLFFCAMSFYMQQGAYLDYHSLPPQKTLDRAYLLKNNSCGYPMWVPHPSWPGIISCFLSCFF